MQCLEAEGFFLLAPELAGGAEGLREGVVGQIHRQVMAHTQVGNHRFEDRFGFPLKRCQSATAASQARPTAPSHWSGLVSSNQKALWSELVG